MIRVFKKSVFLAGLALLSAPLVLAEKTAHHPVAETQEVPAKKKVSKNKTWTKAMGYQPWKSRDLMPPTAKEVGGTISDQEIEKIYKDLQKDIDLEAELQASIVRTESSFSGADQTQYKGMYFNYGEPVNFDHPWFANAPEVYSTADEPIVLDVKYASHEFKTFQHGFEVTKTLNLRGYNGGMVGPTIVARPGDTLRVRLNNLMPPETHPGCHHPSSSDHSSSSSEKSDHSTMAAHSSHGADTGHSAEEECDVNRPHNFNTTNLHTHGLHVDPGGNSDNVLLHFSPGESFDYEFHIPEDHTAGTFWYHAHVHGSTSVQVASGVHGALIIRGDYDEVPAIQTAEERIMIIQGIAFDENGEVEGNENFFVEQWHEHGYESGWHYSINGQVMPRIQMRPGATELWRIVLANVRERLNLKLVNACDSNDVVPLVQLAADGIPFRKKRLADDWGTFLAPGYRSDVMVRSFRRGVYYLVDTTVPGAAELPSQYCDATRGNQEFLLDEKAQNILARVDVTGPWDIGWYPLNHSLNELTRPRSIDDSELIDEIEYVMFDIKPKEGVDPSDPEQFIGDNFEFLINDRLFDPAVINRTLGLGTAQTWLINSKFEVHPYHIHVNHFEVIIRDENDEIIDRYWRDTILSRDPINGETLEDTEIEIRTRYEDFTGRFVMHCHILDHEDRGMMELIDIVE